MLRRDARIVSEIIRAAGTAVFQKTDVSDGAQVHALVARAAAEFDALDTAFNNAGLPPPTTPLAEQATDYATAGIRVNAIAPGPVRTPMTEHWLNGPQMRDKVLADSPIRRTAEPEDIAALVRLLASDLANIHTGAVNPIDGAHTAH